MHLIVLLPILIPLFTAAACLLLWKQPALQRVLSVTGAVAILVAGLRLLSTAAQGEIISVQLGNWPAPFGITVVADLLSSIMVAIVGMIGLAVAVYALFGIDRRRQSFGFHAFLHALLMGVCGAFLTGDLFNLYVWFEVMLIASFVLVALGGEKTQLEGAIKYVTLNLISSALFLAAVGVLYSTVGTLNMADLARSLSSADVRSVLSVAGGILLIAFGIKAAVFPLFFWLPASYHTPPAAISAVMAGLLTKVGVYAMLRIFSLLFAYDFAYVQPVFLAVAGATMVTGVLGAAAQTGFRRILSFHIISQIGYMIMGLAIFTPLALAGTVFYLVHNILAKTSLFLVAGIAQRFTGSDELRHLGGLYRERLWLTILFLVPALSLAGIPPLSGFWAKFALIRASMEAGHYLLIVVAFSVGLLTLYSMTKIWGEAFWKEKPAERPVPDKLDAREIRWMVLPSLALAAMSIILGVGAEPFFLLAYATAEQLLNPNQYINAVLGDT